MMMSQGEQLMSRPSDFVFQTETMNKHWVFHILWAGRFFSYSIISAEKSFSNVSFKLESYCQYWCLKISIRMCRRVFRNHGQTQTVLQFRLILNPVSHDNTFYSLTLFSLTQYASILEGFVSKDGQRTLRICEISVNFVDKEKKAKVKNASMDVLYSAWSLDMFLCFSTLIWMFLSLFISFWAFILSGRVGYWEQWDWLLLLAMINVIKV